MIQNIFIFGANGNVGRTLVRQIYEKGDTNPDKHKNPTRIVGLGSISDYILCPHGLSPEVAIAYSKTASGESRYALSDVLNFARSRFQQLTFVDVTAARELMRDFHLEVMDNSEFGIVTSNKNPLTMMTTDEFRRVVAKTGRYGYRCSVMAGANAINELIDFRDLGDSVRGIEGCFSGTLGYICTGLQQERSFSEIVREARKLGYTEPHPREDLSGKDVAKKILLLARTAGLDLSMENLTITPFIPLDYLGIENTEQFLEALEQLDISFLKKIKKAKARGNVLRYVARLGFQGDKPVVEIGPRNIPATSPLGTLTGTLNKIVIATDTYTPEKPCIIEAPGAGLEVTAQNVRRDLLNQLQARTISF